MRDMRDKVRWIDIGKANQNKGDRFEIARKLFLILTRP